MTKKGKNNIWGITFILPALLVLAVLFLKPIFDLVMTSFTNQNLLRPDRLNFIGIQNYIQMVSNPDFWNALSNSIVFTIVFTIAVTVISIGVSVLIAVLMNHEFFLKRFLFALLLLPWVTSFMSSAFAFTLMYDYAYGVINYLIADVLHIGKPQNWLGQLDTVMIAVIIVSVWHFLPFSILVLSNALKQIPEELIESAGIDGANGFRLFMSIKLPLMKPALITLLVVRFAAAFKMFDSIFLLTKGGPGDATTTLPLWYYKMGFQAFRSGMGAAIGVTLIMIVLSIYFIFIRIFGEDAV